MSGYYERIQGTDRLPRIRRVRRAVFAGILALTLVLMITRLGSEGASIKPFFLPVDGILEVGLIVGLITAIVGLYLRNLEVRTAQRDSQRYHMAKSSMARALRTAGFAFGVAAILTLAFTPSLAAAIVSDPPQIIDLWPGGQETVTFTSPDPLGVSFVTHAVVAVMGGEASVVLFRNNETVSATPNLTVSERVRLEVEPSMWVEPASWSIVFQNAVNTTSYVTFVLEKGIVPTFFSTVPFLLGLYGVTQVAWWTVLRPTRERTKDSRMAAAELAEGERVFDESAEAPVPANPHGMRASSIHLVDPPAHFADPSPPPPPVPAPTRPSRAEPPAPPKDTLPPPPVVRTPETAATLAAKAARLLSDGDLTAALDAHDDALRLDPDHQVSLEARAEILVRLERRTEALEAYRRLLSKGLRSSAILLAIAGLHAADRRWRDCLEAVDGVLRERPTEASALELKGDALTNLGRRPEALAAYEAAAVMDPARGSLLQKIEEVRVDVPGLLSRALIASASGNYARALSLFDDILEVEPSNVNALIGKAVAYRRSGKPQEAVNCLDLVLGVQPTNASALLNRGNILLEEDNLEAALEAFDRLTQLYPDDEEAWAAQGDVLMRMGRDDDALQAYAEAQKRSPHDEDIQRRILEVEAAKTVRSGIFQELCTIKGIGKTRAKALIDEGFAAAEDFANAEPKDLMVARGITRKVAEDLVAHFREALAENPGAEQVLK